MVKVNCLGKLMLNNSVVAIGKLTRPLCSLARVNLSVCLL